MSADQSEAIAPMLNAPNPTMGPPPYSHGQGQLYYNSSPQPVPPPHVNMVNPHGWFPLIQRPAFFIAQYGCVAPPQQCPVPAVGPGFHPDFGPYHVMNAPPCPREATPPPQLAPEIPANHAPLPDPVPTNKKGLDTKEVEEGAAATLETILSPSSTSNGVAHVESEMVTVSLPPHQLEAPLESPMAQPEELPLPAPTSQSVTSVAPAVPRPLVQQMPTTADQEVAAETALEEPSTKPQVEETLPEVASNVSEEVSEKLDANEEPPSPVEVVSVAPPPAVSEEKEEPPPQSAPPAITETTMQAAVSGPKKKGSNKNKAAGEHLDAFEEHVVVQPEPEPAPAPEPKPQPPVPQDEAELTWKNKEDKLDAENIELDSPQPTTLYKENQYKEDVLNPSPPPRETTPPPQFAPEIPADHAPFPDPVPTNKKDLNTKEVKAGATATLETPHSHSSTSNGVAQVESEVLTVSLPPHQLEAPLESPMAQPEELPLPAPTSQSATSVAPAVPRPLVQQMPTTADQELAAEAAVEDPSTKPQVEETLPEVASNVSEEVSEKLDAKEEPPSPVEVVSVAPPPADSEEKEETPPQSAPLTVPETTMQAAVSGPKKKKKKKKGLNKNKVGGHLIDAFKEEQVVVNPKPEPAPAQEPEPKPPVAQEEAELTLKKEEDKLDAENIELKSPQPTTPDTENQYKEDVMNASPPPGEATPPPQLAPEIPADHAPLLDPVPTNKKGLDSKEVEEGAAATLETPLSPSTTSNGVAQVESEVLTVSLPPHQLEAPLESPITQPEELPLPAPTSQSVTSVAPAVPRPLVQQMPTTADLEVAAETAVEEPSTKPQVEETLPEVASNVSEEVSEKLDANEEPPSPVEVVSVAPPPAVSEEKEETPPQSAPLTVAEITMQVAVSGPKKKKKKKKGLNKNKAGGHLIDAFKEEQVVVNPKPEPAPAQEPEPKPPVAQEEAELTLKKEEDKLDAENIELKSPQPTTPDKENQYKEDVMNASPPPREATPPPQLAPEIPADHAPLLDPVPTNKKGLDTKEVEEGTAATLETPLSPSSTSNGVAQVESEVLTVSLPPHQLEAPLESPMAQPEELPILALTSQSVTSVAPAVPRPLVQQMPTTADQEVAAETAVEDPSTKPQVEETLPEVASNVSEEVSEKLDANEEPPSPVEVVSVAPPPAISEEKEELPPQSVSPAITETTMQEQKEKKRKLGLQHIPAISAVILHKAPNGPLEPSLPDFTPAFTNLKSPGMEGGRRGPMQRKIISGSFNENVQLNKAEKSWKPSVNQSVCSSQPEELEEKITEQTDLLKHFSSILNKLTTHGFEWLMTQVKELTIDTEERLKGVIDITFEKAISEPASSEIYAKMCRVLIGVKVQTKEKPGSHTDFSKLLLNRCQKEFETERDNNEIFKKKEKELEAASGEKEKQRLWDEFKFAKTKAMRRSLGNIKFIGELFKLKMLTEVIMHDCIKKLLKDHDDESLEILCKLLSIIGKDLDVEKEKCRVDQCFHQLRKIVKEKKDSSQIHFMLQEVLDLRTNKWVPCRGYQSPKTIDQNREEANEEEQMEVQEAFNFKEETDRCWNTEYIRDEPPTDRSGLSQNVEAIHLGPSLMMKILKNPLPNFNMFPKGKGMWGKGCGSGSNATSTNSDSDSDSCPSTGTLNTSSALQQRSMSSTDTDRRVPQGSSSIQEHSDHFDRQLSQDQNHLQVMKRRFSGEKEERVQSREQLPQGVSSMIDYREKGDTAATPPLPQPSSKCVLSKEQVMKKAKLIIEEYLTTNDMKETGESVEDLNSTALLFGFVHEGLNLTLDHSTIHRKNMGSLFHHLIKTGSLPAQQYYKGLQEVLEEAEDIAIDIPHMWLYLAELITPMLHDGGVPMGELFSVISEHLVPRSRVGDLLVHILILLCKEKGLKEAGTMWREAGLQWKDFLPESVHEDDINKLVIENNVEFTLGDGEEQRERENMRIT